MIGPKSENLFHFTRTIDVLEGILKNGFYPRFCLEDISWARTKDNHMAFPMVCFCDIPIGRISEHTAFYGEFGLGLTKEWGLKNKLSPVAYTHSTGAVSDLLRYIIKSDVDKLVPDEGLQKDLLNELYKQHSMMKPINGRMFVAGKPVDKDFYQESEWRHIPEFGDIINEEEFEDKKEEKNSEMEKRKLEFLPTDIKYIFVRSETDIPRIYDFIHKQLEHFPHVDIKALVTRIISLETIANDF